MRQLLILNTSTPVVVRDRRRLRTASASARASSAPSTLRMWSGWTVLQQLQQALVLRSRLQRMARLQIIAMQQRRSEAYELQEI